MSKTIQTQFKSQLDPTLIFKPSQQPKPYVREIVWFNVFKLTLLHLLFLLSLFLAPYAHNGTFLFTFILIFFTILGVQVGAHRLWSHRSYSANGPVRTFLMLCQTLSMQNDLYEWVRDHRAHHKWSDTAADPHDNGRGFFFAHIGWLMVKKHPDVLRQGGTLDLSDVANDPVVRFQRRFIYLLVPILWGVLPTALPVLLWNEAVLLSFLLCVIFRYLLTLHITWAVNSFAHRFGSRPFNSAIRPTDATIRHLMVGEGFHNYHHVFPQDYSTSELGPMDVFNPPTAFINLLYHLGWACDLKKPSVPLIQKTIESTGNESQRKLNLGFRNSLYEWVTGLAVSTGPLWVLLLWKYTFRYFYLQNNQTSTGLTWNLNHLSF